MDDLTPEERRALRPRFDWRIALPVLLSGLAHFMFAAIAEERPPEDFESSHREHMELMSRLLAVGADPAEPADEKESADVGGTGTRAKGEEGVMGLGIHDLGGAGHGGFGNGHGRLGGAHIVDSAPHIARSADLREAAEFGMIGLLGAGAGGGGRGEGIGLGTIGTIGHGAGTGRMWDALPQQGPSGVRAGEWDDNASYREFRRLLSTSGSGFRPIDVSDRQFIVVRDVNGKPIPSCDVLVLDGKGASTTLRTMSTGRAILFPHAEGLGASPFTASARCGGNAITVTWSAGDDKIVEMKGKEPRDPSPFTIDIGFVLDTTGSMREEIAAVKTTLRKVASSVEQGVRVGLVEYKDRGDDLVTRVYPMDSNIGAFNESVSAITASGGGDIPESMAAGLHDGVDKLAWRDAASARLLFVIADAPPHLDYQNEPDYRDDTRAAARRGIQIHTIAASGMDDLGQMVFRQIAQYTGGTELFVLRGGAGPESVGGGDPLSSCGGTQKQYSSGNLDALILAHVRAARTAIDADPMIIRGLHNDWVAPSCNRQQ